MFWLILLIIIFIETFGIYYIKKKYLLVGIISYCIVAILLYILAINNNIGIINHTWNIFSSIFVFIVGYLYFSEQITNIQLIGIIFGFIGLFFMNLKT